MTPRLAVLISGRGSNLVALLAQRAQIPADIVLVVSDQGDAAGLGKARDARVPVAVVERGPGQTKQAHEIELAEVLLSAAVTHLALAGFMRILSAEFIAQFTAIFNIHPALLPAFPGLNTHARALAAGARVHGCTVHLVDSGVDSGPILAQASLQVRAEETQETLARRVLQLEHGLYATALANVFASQNPLAKPAQTLKNDPFARPQRIANVAARKSP